MVFDDEVFENKNCQNLWQDITPKNQYIAELKV